MINLSGKRILVTGVATGIGRAVALKVAAAGAKVAGFDVDRTKGTATMAEAGAAAT